jgi:hypothetical protein
LAALAIQAFSARGIGVYNHSFAYIAVYSFAYSVNITPTFVTDNGGFW